MLPNGSKTRKGLPMARGLLDYFPDALAAVAEVSMRGAQQHHTFDTEGNPRWDKTKSTDHADCIIRHLADRGKRQPNGIRHSAATAWRALALLQTEIEADKVKTSSDEPTTWSGVDLAAGDDTTASVIIGPKGSVVYCGNDADEALAVLHKLFNPTDADAGVMSERAVDQATDKLVQGKDDFTAQVEAAEKASSGYPIEGRFADIMWCQKCGDFHMKGGSSAGVPFRKKWFSRRKEFPAYK